MAESELSPEVQAEAQTQVIEPDGFASLLQKEFKPRTDRAKEAVEQVVQLQCRRFPDHIRDECDRGHGRGSRRFSRLHVVKTVDSATPDLNTFCAGGEHVGTIEIEVCTVINNDQHVFMKRNFLV